MFIWSCLRECRPVGTLANFFISEFGFSSFSRRRESRLRQCIPACAGMTDSPEIPARDESDVSLNTRVGSGLLRSLPQNFMDDASMHVRQSEVPPRITIRKLLMVESHGVQNRGMQIVDTHRILFGLETDLVR